MTRRIRCTTALSVLAIWSGGLALADLPKVEPDLAGFKTVETAATAQIARVATQASSNADSPAYLGILLDPGARQALVISDVDLDSPASRAGVQLGDVLQKLDGQVIKDVEGVFEVLNGKSAGETLDLTLSRQDKPVNAKAILTPWSRMRPAQDRLRRGLGVQVAAAKEGEGVTIEQVFPGSTGDRAKLKVGEVLLKIDDVALNGPDQFYDLIRSKPSDGTVVATLRLAEKAVDMKIKLDPEPNPNGPPTGPGGLGGQRGGGYWTKPGFRLAIVCVEYPDVKHNPQITNEAWREALFSEGTYNKTNVTGQAVHGSFRDYFLEQSCGYFKADGGVFDWVEVGKKREEYATGNRTALLTEALDKLLDRDGEEALKDFDGVFFVYAGARFPAPRGSLYWPHRASISHKGKRWPYFIVDEGGPRMQGLSVLCHEFGHMLGMPDLYASPENPGMEGLGVWCNMSQQPNRMIPQHFGAWVKEKLGWLKPTVIDPTVKQKLILAPIENSPKECFKVLIRPDGSEYILLENRRKSGFDQSLPAEGLLIWHVLGNRPSLKESHGIEGPSGPRVLLNEVPYPSGANDAYTPYTTPSSRSPLGGGLPVSITNIRRLPDGRITFHIGYEYQ
jgi:M6 family metalloprotease-like protein